MRLSSPLQYKVKKNSLDSKHKKLLEQALKLAIEHPESGYLQELAFLNDVELQAAIDEMTSLKPIDK